MGTVVLSKQLSCTLLEKDIKDDVSIDHPNRKSSAMMHQSAIIADHRNHQDYNSSRYLLDYTCRARWPEGLLCSTISLKSCNLAQILQSPKSEIVTCVMFSTHTNTSLIKPHLTELDEIHRNRPKSNYNLAKNLQSWSVTSDRQTDPRTEIHTFFI